MAKSRAVTVTDEATRIDTSSEDTIGGSSLLFWNAGEVTVRAGGDDVTVANGLPVAPLSWSPGFQLGVDEGLYAIVDTGETAEIRVIETGL